MNIFWHKTVPKKRFFIPQYGTFLWYDTKLLKNVQFCSRPPVMLYRSDYSRIKSEPLESEIKNGFRYLKIEEPCSPV